MDTPITQAIITAGAALVTFSLGWLAKWVTGASRAEVQKDDSTAATSYAALARQAAIDLKQLRQDYDNDKQEKDKIIKDLTGRVETLENEKIELADKITFLETENKILKRQIDKRDNTKPLPRPKL